MKKITETEVQVTTQKEFSAYGTTVRTGDTVTVFPHPKAMLAVSPEIGIEAMFIHAREDSILLFSNQHEHFLKGGLLSEEHINGISILQPAKTAIRTESRNRLLTDAGQLVIGVSDGAVVRGELLGAFDGRIAVLTDDEVVSADAKGFMPIELRMDFLKEEGSRDIVLGKMKREIAKMLIDKETGAPTGRPAFMAMISSMVENILDHTNWDGDLSVSIDQGERRVLFYVRDYGTPPKQPVDKILSFGMENITNIRKRLSITMDHSVKDGHRYSGVWQY
jgi:hypothetical protein